MRFIIIINCLKFLIIVLPVLISVAYLTLIERKIIGYSQLRKGPNIVGIYGLLQPLSDGLKLFTKELIIPSHVDLISYIFSPILALFISLGIWLIFPFDSFYNIINFNLGLLFILAFGSINIYSILISGWSSNSKFSFLGSIRAAAQMISYEVCLSLILFVVILSSCSLDLIKIVSIQNYSTWFLFPFLFSSLMFFVSCLAETNRSPFDLSEGESELVSGYNVEYSSMSFAYFFLSEYSHIIFMSFLFSLLFLGGGSITLILKSLFLIFCFIWARCSFPRFRYDQLMHLCWKTFLPLSISILIATNFILWIFIGLTY